MSLAIQSIKFRIPILEKTIELKAVDKKVIAVALGSLAFFALQLGLSLTVSLALSFTFTVITHLSEKFLRTEEHQKNDWFNTSFDYKEIGFYSALLLLRPLIFQVVCWSLGIPLPIPPQTEVVSLILSQPWKMIPMVSIMAPITEEILFRGFLMERLEDAAQLLNRHTFVKLSQKTQDRVVNLIQAIVFGAVHLGRKIQDGAQIPVFLILSLWGYVFGEAKQNQKTLFAPMIFHSANNSSALFYIFSLGKNEIRNPFLRTRVLL